MTNILQDGAAWLADRLKEHASVTIAYHRSSQTISPLSATVTMHRYELADSEGFGITALSRDYILTAADLVLGSETITPRSGDRIAETIGGVSQTFEVMALGDLKESEPVDTDGLMILIHTKKVG